MVYNEELAERIRPFFKNQKRIEEKKMMGGLTFMVNGKMCVGILKNELLVRINPDIYLSELNKPESREMNLTGRPMKGFLFINEKGTKENKGLKYWVNLALEYNKISKASKKIKKP